MTPQETITIPSSAPAAGSRSIDSALGNWWARLLIPSYSDLFFLAAFAWLFMGTYGWSGLLADGDVGWHIRTGEYILNQGGVPHHDLYSFSRPGAPWYAWEWLSDVIDALLFRAFGLKGVVLAAGTLIAFFATTMMRRIMRRGVHMFVAMIISLLGVGSASMHFLARPHVFTLVFLSISLWLLETDRDGQAGSQRLWCLVPITLVWTNLHGGFLVLVAILGLTAVGSAAEAWFGDKNFAPAIRYGTLTVGCAAVSLVNPYGWGLHQHVVEYLRSDWIRNVVQEFQSPSFRGEGMIHFEFLLFTGLVTAGALVRRRKIVEALWIFFFAYLALSSVRHVPVFIAVTIALIAGEVGSWWNLWTHKASKNSLPGILSAMGADSAAGFRRTSLWPVLVIAALVVINDPIKWPKDFPKELFPVDIVKTHEAEIVSARLLTTDQWADYLIFRNPKQKVFLDGRSDFYGQAIGTEYIKVLNGAWNWRDVMRKYQFNLALVPVDQPIAQLLKQSPDWRVVEDDGEHILLVPRASLVLTTGNSLP